MTIDDKIRDEKLQYDINREGAKIPELPSGKIDKYEYLTGKEISPSNQCKIIEQAKFTYSTLRKSIEEKQKQLKQTKTIEDRAIKQIINTSQNFHSISNLFSKEFLAVEAKDEFNKTKKDYNSYNNKGIQIELLIHNLLQ